MKNSIFPFSNSRKLVKKSGFAHIFLNVTEISNALNFDEDHRKGKGVPQSEVDMLCKDLHDAYREIQNVMICLRM